MRAFSVRRTFALCASLLSLAALPATAAATSNQTEIDAAVGKAAEYIRAQQDVVTGFIPGFGGDWATTSLAAAGVDAADVHGPNPGDPSLQDFLLAEYTQPTWEEDPPGSGVAEYTRSTLVAYAAGLDPARLSASSNQPAQLAGRWNPGTGSFGEASTYNTVFGVLAMKTTPLPDWALEPAVSFLRRNQHDDGGWTYTASLTRPAQEEPSEEDITGAAIAAMCEAGVPAYDPTVSSALSFLHGRMVKATGGIEYLWGPPNADTNAWVISGLNACDIDPQSIEWRTADSMTPVDFLLSLQLKTGAGTGGFGWADATAADLYATQDALRALAGGVFTAEPQSVRTPPTVAAGTPVPHLLAIELAPGKMRMCKVTAPAGAPLTEVLAAAEATSYPPGCVTELSISGGRVESIGGIEPQPDEAWLARIEHAAPAVAAEQPVGFGDVVSLRLGERPDTPVDHVALPAPIIVQAQGGPAGKRGKRGPKGKPGRHAKRCKSGGRKHRKRCRARHARGSQPRALPASKPSR